MDDTAATRLFLFGILRELRATTKKLSLVEHADAVLFRLAAEPGGRLAYKTLRKACKLTAGQIAPAVRSLVEAGIVVRDHDPKDHRKLILALNDEGQDAYGALFKAAESHDDK